MIEHAYKVRSKRILSTPDFAPIVIFWALMVICSNTVFAQHLEVSNLKCEYKINPKGIEASSPGLSWQLQSTGRNILQTAYHILVADDSLLLMRGSGNVWNSGRVNSGSSNQVFYQGKKMDPAKRYYWKVMVWDNKNHVSTWSNIAHWQTGLVSTADWKGAHWIAYEKMPDSLVVVLPIDGTKDKYAGNNILPLLRKEFNIKMPVQKATMFISGLGHFEMSVNGKKAGDHFLDPGWTKFDRQALYVVFDLTSQLKPGTNTLGVMLGNGFYYVPHVSKRYRKTKNAFGYPKMIARLLIEYADGTSANVVTDQSWQTSPGPVTFSSIFGGEVYDANLEQPGWDQPGFKTEKWKKVIIVDGPPVLNAQTTEPLKVMEQFTPKKTIAVQPGVYVFDLGQNASGIPAIKVRGKKGDTVRIYPSELLRPDTLASQRPTGGPYYLQYVLKGNGVEIWQPRFTYYGFRYLQVNGAVPEGGRNPQSFPVLVEIKGLHVRNAAERVGEFTNSNELFNRTNTLIDWAIKSNMASVLTDCPHREKLGWLEEAHLMGNSIQYNYDIAHIGRKQIDDMIYSQTDSGLIPETAPEYVRFTWGGDMFRDSPEWGSNGIIMPWYLYQWYGDKQLLSKSYPMMQRYINYLKTKAQGHILKQGLGDWYDLGPLPPGVSQLTPMGVTGTAIYYYDLNIMSKIAVLLNKPADVAAYNKLAADVKQAFNDTFYNQVTKQYATGSQTANAMAVYMNLVTPTDKEAVIENIIKDIRKRHDSLTAGDIGYRYLLRVLHEAGRSDVIFNMNNNTEVPGYGYQLAKGATALTESWQALPNVSNNHLMLGHLMEWFYRGLAGINQSDSSIAYKHIVIKPEIVGDVTSARGVYHSVYGKIVSEWKKEGNRFSLHVEIPVNSTATIYIPVSTNDKTMIEVGSGVYDFKR